jgi:selenocysteine lyase/cysteine desulfurase
MPIESEDQIVELFVQKMESEGDIDFAIIDHISSASALVFPIKRLVAECRKRNIIVCIDGAHAPGQIDLYLDDLNADFYAGNFHKWAYATRGCALLWTNPKYHTTMEPLTTSHLYKGSLHEKFYQQGTDDQSNFFALPVALEYHKSMGFEGLHQNANELLEYARKKLCDEVGCEMYPVPSSMEAPFMKIVKLPKSEKVPVPDITITDRLVVEILNVHNTVIAITTSNGHIWMRISCNCYNTFADYERLVALIKMVVAEML